MNKKIYLVLACICMFLALGMGIVSLVLAYENQTYNTSLFYQIPLLLMFIFFEIYRRKNK